MLRSALLAALALLASCSGGGGSSTPVDVVTLDFDAGNVVGTLAPLWGDHYDLSFQHFDYAAEPGFVALVQTLAPRSWRCSIGRWEIGFPPPAGGDSLVPSELQACEREFYRGANDLVSADDPANYDFTYLDAQLAGIETTGAQPYLCFDYMPFTLSSEQDPLNNYNFNISQAGIPYSQYSFSNGIRTAPPADEAVYARVVRNSIRHVRGLFAGTTDFGVQYFEIGNEPDIVNGLGSPAGYFWTGDRAPWLAMYEAIASEVAADGALANIKLGGGSFAFLPGQPSPTFLEDVLSDVAYTGSRLDFLSYHSYSDDPIYHLDDAAIVRILVTNSGLAPEIIDAEWGRDLNGLDPVYDTIEHGLFRTKVLLGLEVLGIGHAHEALLRNPGTQAGELGLVRTGPPAPKPVSDCYRALALCTNATEALEGSALNGLWATACREPGLDRVLVVCAGDAPVSGHATRIELSIVNLPFGGADFEVRRWEVSQATFEQGHGPKLASTTQHTGNSFATSLTYSKPELLVFELVRH